MKKDVAINLFGVVALLLGFGLFLFKQYPIGLIFTLLGIGVYFYNKFKKSD